jgi:putative flippase GtrA
MTTRPPSATHGMGLREPMRFVLSGCAGFATDALLFLLLTQPLGLHAYPARVLAFLPATLLTWTLQRRYVFPGRSVGADAWPRGQYLRHVAVQSSGLAVNFASFWLAVEAGLGRGSANLVPLAIGSLCAMLSNYLGARYVVFRT